MEKVTAYICLDGAYVLRDYKVRRSKLMNSRHIPSLQK